MERRQILKAAAGGIGAAAIGGMALTGSAAADVETGLFDVQESYSIDSESGRLEHLTLTNINVLAEWSNFDHPVEGVDWTLDAEVTDGDDNTESAEIGSADVEYDEPDEYSGSATQTMGNVDLVETFGQDYFEVETLEEYDGEDITEQFDIAFTLTAAVADVDENAISEDATGDTDLGITNLGADTDVGGNGTLDHGDEDGGDYEPEDTPTDEPETDTPDPNLADGVTGVSGDGIGNNNDVAVEVTLDWDHNSDQHDGTTTVTIPANGWLSPGDLTPPSSPGFDSYDVTVTDVTGAA